MSNTIFVKSENTDENDVENNLQAIFNGNEPIETTECCNNKPTSMVFMCRLCAKNVPDDVEKISIDTELKQRIQNVLPIQVELNDGLPQHLCEACMNRIRMHQRFVERVVHVDQMLRLQFSDTGNNASDLLFEYLNSTPNSNALQKNIKLEPTDEPDTNNYETEYLETNYDTSTYTCRLCDLILDNSHDIVTHSIQNHYTNGGLFICVQCNYGFKSATLLSQHVQSEHQSCSIALNDSDSDIEDDNEYQCHLCGECFRLNPLKRHFAKYHEFENWDGSAASAVIHFCAVCNETFPDAERHEHPLDMEMVRMNKVFCCEYCDRCFGSSIGLNSHRSSQHSGAFPFLCRVCDTSFDSITKLIVHKLTHGEEDKFPVMKQYLCQDCDKSYLHLSHLNAHRNLKHSSRNGQDHNQTADYPMELKLVSTQKTKTNLSTLICPICSKQFTYQNVLLNHLKLFHSNNEMVERPFVCDVCDLSFRREITLKKHRKRCHECTVGSGKFVLMVDMYEDGDGDNQNEGDIDNDTVIKNAIISANNQREFSILQMKDLEKESLIHLAGNTFQIDGKDYVIVDDNDNDSILIPEQYHLEREPNERNSFVFDVNGLQSQFMVDDSVL